MPDTQGLFMVVGTVTSYPVGGQPCPKKKCLIVLAVINETQLHVEQKLGQF